MTSRKIDERGKQAIYKREYPIWSMSKQKVLNLYSHQGNTNESPYHHCRMAIIKMTGNIKHSEDVE